MGDVADMMLDGTLCSCCGQFLSETPSGYPMMCTECSAAETLSVERAHTRPRCSCGKRFKTKGALADHQKSTKHATLPADTEQGKGS